MATLYGVQGQAVELGARPARQGQDPQKKVANLALFPPAEGPHMSIALKDALAGLTVPELKDLISLPAGRCNSEQRLVLWQITVGALA